MGRTFLGSTSCWSYVTLSSGMSVVTSCASVNERIHSSSNCFVVGSFSLQKHQLRVEQEAALSRQVSRGRLLWPAPAKETTASRCSCRSPVGPGALIGDSLTWGNEAIPVLLPTLLPHRAPRQFVSPSAPGDSGRLGALRTGGMSSNARTPRNEGCGPVPAAVR